MATTMPSPLPDVLVLPGKLLRLADMVETMLDEVHATPPDPATRARLQAFYEAALIEVGSTLSDSLLDELGRLQCHRAIASDDDLRIALVQLAGWLRGVRFGLAAALLPYRLDVPIVTDQA